MSNLFIETVSVDATLGCRINDPEFVETRFEKIGELYRSLVKEYGRCQSKQYIGKPDSKPRQIGWVFKKREKYTDCNDKFLMETWVSVHTAKPTITTTHHFAKF